MAATTASNGRPGGLPIGKQLAPLKVTSADWAGKATTPAIVIAAIAANVLFSISIVSQWYST
jgi:hypothetical protein